MIVKALCKRNIIQNVLHNHYTLISSSKRIIETGVYSARTTQFEMTVFV